MEEKTIKALLGIFVAISVLAFFSVLTEDSNTFKTMDKPKETKAKTEAKTEEVPLMLAQPKPAFRYTFSSNPKAVPVKPKVKVDTVFTKQQYTPMMELPVGYYGVGSMYSVPVGINQTIRDKDSEKKIVSEQKRIVLSYTQKANGKETNFSLEATNPTKEERLELYKLFVHEAREAQESLRSYKETIKINEGNNVFNF